MTNQSTKIRIQWWAIKAGKQRDRFIKFVLYWFCFNAWITNLSNKDKDSDAIEWFIKNDNCLRDIAKDYLSDSMMQSKLKSLQKLSPVPDMRPGHQHQRVELEDINDIGQVIKYIYQIRCNLFHGSKNPMNSRDEQLVYLSSWVLEKWIELARIKCK